MRIHLLLIVGLAFIITSCAPKHADIVVAKFGNHEIKMNDFEKAYEKNVGGFEQAEKDSLSKLENFLDLYVKFRMKLRDAEIRGFDQDPTLQNELNDYKQKIGVSYILEKDIVDPWIDTLYNRRKWEYRVSHIMITTLQGKRSDSAAHQLAESVLDSIKQGASFAEMAKKYSDDRFSKNKGGDLFYLTSGIVPWEFEDAVYATDSGKVYPKVVKTRYGYHIIKVTDKRQRIPKIRASHILISYAHGKGKPDTAYAKATADSVMQQLKAGADFAELAKKYSDDPGSKDKGGDLNWFQRRQMVPEFDEAAFNLKKVGDISGIVQTPYGFHIIKLTGKQEYPSFNSEEKELKEMLQKTRYHDLYNALLDGYIKKYDYNLNDATLNEIIAHTDSIRIGSPVPGLSDFKDDVLYSYTGDSLTAGAFLDRLENGSDYSNQLGTKDVITKAVEKFSGDDILNRAAMDLDKVDPDFAALMNDYKNGIYIFKLQDEEVWSKLNQDSTKLYQYYENNKDKFMWPDRVDISEIYVKKDSLANYIYSQLEKGQSFDSLAAKYTEKSEYKKSAGHYGLIAAHSTFLAQVADSLKPGEFSMPERYAGGYSIVKLNAVSPAHPKTFEDAKAEISGAYQDAESKKLEKNYIESLNKIYKPELYYAKLKEAFKKN